MGIEAANTRVALFFLFPFSAADDGDCDDGKKTFLSPPPTSPEKKQSVFHVAHLRGLFPDSAFKSVTMANLDGERRKSFF